MTNFELNENFKLLTSSSIHNYNNTIKMLSEIMNNKKKYLNNSHNKQQSSGRFY